MVKANGLEIWRTQEKHPHGTTDRITAVPDLVEVLADSELKRDSKSSL